MNLALPWDGHRFFSNPGHDLCVLTCCFLLPLHSQAREVVQSSGKKQIYVYIGEGEKERKRIMCRNRFIIP